MSENTSSERVRLDVEGAIATITRSICPQKLNALYPGDDPAICGPH